MKKQHHHIPGADNVRLHVVTTGSGPSLILFLHGFPEFWLAWHRQLEEFGRTHVAAAMDLRGYNASDKPREVAAYAMAQVAGDVAAVIRALSPQRPAVVVGHDWGGIAAWHLARAHPELIEQLVIINAPHPVLFGRELKRNPRQMFASSYAAAFQIRGIAEAVLRLRRFAILRWMVFGLTRRPDAFDPQLRAAYLQAWSQPGALRGGLSYYRAAGNKRMLFEPAAAWTISVPTLALWGDRDQALLPAVLVGLHELVPALTLHRHPTATHWIVHEEPAWIHHHMRAVLASR